MKNAHHVIFMAFVLVSTLPTNTKATSSSTAYDITRMLNEPHPLAGQIGTSWSPAIPTGLPTLPQTTPGSGVPQTPERVATQLPQKSSTPPINESLLEINPRFYIGGSGGMSTFETDISNTTGTAKLDEDDFGFKFYGGVNINRILGLEAHYADLGTASLSGNPGDRFDSGGKTFQFLKSATITSDAISYGLAATAGYDVTKWFRPFAKFGVHRWELEVTAVSSTTKESASDDGIDTYFGAGFQANLYKGLSVRAEFERFKFDDDDVDFFSAGANYQF